MAKHLYDSEPLAGKKNKSTRSYLIQARDLINKSESISSSSSSDNDTVQILGKSNKRLVAKVVPKKDIIDSFADIEFSQHPRIDDTPKPKAKALYSAVTKTKPNSAEWTTVKRNKSATSQGTKSTTVSAKLPVDHTVLPHLLTASPEVILHEVYKILTQVKDAASMLANNPIISAQWNPLRNQLVATYGKPVSDELCQTTYTAMAAFFNAVESEIQPMDRPTFSSVKWISIPRFQPNGQAYTESDILRDIQQNALL